MDNFDDFENKSYQPAKVVRYSLKDHLTFFYVIASAWIQINFIVFSDLLFGLFKSRKPKDISGQVALVTGGANGLGRAIAFRLGREKCNVAICDLNLSEAQKTAEEIAEKYKVQTAAFKVDVSDFDAIQKLKEEIEKKLGCVDILVNNAGILSTISLREGQPKDIQKVIDVNLTSHFWTVRTFLPKMIERKRGHIVAISSLGGKISFPLACSYCATKFGVRGFMWALYDELCVDNQDKFVKLTTVYPAFISTRKELCDILDTVQEIAPRMSPKYVANEVVLGMLRNKSDITLPIGSSLFQIINWLPTNAMKFTKAKVSPVAHLKKY